MASIREEKRVLTKRILADLAEQGTINLSVYMARLKIDTGFTELLIFGILNDLVKIKALDMDAEHLITKSHSEDAVQGGTESGIQ